jgi:ferritin-like metal-binding protein YciE
LDSFFRCGYISQYYITSPSLCARIGALAKQLGMKDAVKLLDQNLQEEIKTDILLSQLAETVSSSSETTTSSTRKAA